MGSPVQFQLNLSGTFAAALAPVNSGLAKTDAGIEKARKSLQLFEAEAVKLNRGGFNLDFKALSGSGPLLTFDLMQGARAATDAVQALARSFVTLGQKIAATVGQEQDLTLALKESVGAATASDLKNLAADMSSNTRFDDGTFLKSWLPLVNAGVGGKQMLDDLSTAAVDISTLEASGEAGYQAAMDAFSGIAQRRDVNERTLKALKINEADFFARLAEEQGWSVKQAHSLVAAGKVDAQTLLGVALEQRAAQQGGSIGLPALHGNETWGATLQRLSNLQGNLFKKLEDSPGLEGARRAVESIIGALTGDVGDRIMGSLGRAFEAIAKVITPERVERFVSGAVSAMESLGKNPMVLGLKDLFLGLGQAIGSVWSILQDSGALLVVGLALEVVGRTLSAVASIIQVAAFGWAQLFDVGKQFGSWLVDVVADGFELLGGLINAFMELPGQLWDAGKNAAVGFLDGLKSMGAAFIELPGQLAGSVVDSVKMALGISSPSKVFAELGGYSAEGFALGLEGGSDRVEQSARRSISGAATAGLSMASQGLQGGAAISIGDVNVYMPEGAHGSPGEFGRELGQAVRVEIMKTLDELAGKMGLVPA